MVNWREKYPEWVARNGNPKPRTPLVIRQEIYDIQLANLDNGVTRLETYIDRKKAILHRCTCGEEFLANPDTTLNGGQCKQCRYKKVRKKNASTADEYDRKLAAIGTGVVRIGEYLNAQSPTKHRCSCGNEDWIPQPASVLRGCRCDRCGAAQRANNRRYSHEEYQALLDSKGITVRPLERYIDTKTEIKHLCDCGKPFNASPGHVLRGLGCKDCGKWKKSQSRVKISQDHNRYLRRLEEKDRGDIVPLEPYRGARVQILHKCPICGSEDWLEKPTHVLHKRPCCPNCSKFQAENNAIYLAVDEAGIYKIGHTSWTHASERFIPMNRSRKRHRPDAIPLICHVLCLVRVNGKASLHEKHLLSLSKDNPYDGAQFDGHKETRTLALEQQQIAQDYIDNIAKEHADISDINCKLAHYIKNVATSKAKIGGYWARRIASVKWDGQRCTVQYESRYFPNRMEAERWQQQKKRLSWQALANLGKASRKKQAKNEELPSGVFIESRQKGDKTYHAVRAMTRLGGLGLQRSFSFGIARTREEAIALAIRERNQQIQELLTVIFEETPDRS